ncbi:MAG: hypothetical protein IPF69_03990 [Chitinophagaceae bacterium]|jgi:uncharacterized protein YxjI|nr:hypothetical protein [Chitinophagaceae bacterium]MBK8301318.1 hypothetical protein [Chitinophagaceae bacterium]MBK9658352.1 hypothetical protein [Chitinophagaceae bacterium]MBP6416169.1 hypothetical protein [Chitinophagaceae bacterium]
MKQIFRTHIKQEMLRQLVLIAGMLIMFLLPAKLFGQSDTTQAPAADTATVAAEEPAKEEEPSMLSPTVEFKAVQKSDNSIDLKAGLKAKVKNWPVNLYKMKVTFFQVVNDEDQELGFAITDNSGKAVFNVKGDSLKTNTDGKVQFKMVFAGNKMMESAEEVIAFKRARLEITPVKEDSLLTVQVKLVEVGTGAEIPIPEAAVGIFVKRLFLPLKVGEGTTDENGEASVEFPANLPGDAKGNLTLIAKLDENETYGNLEASVVQQWGTSVSNKIEDQPRALWSSNPPMWMLITFIILMVAVWGHYIVIIYELFRLRKEQPHPPTDATNM